MGGRSPDDYRTTYAGRICLLRMPVKATPDSANKADAHRLGGLPS